MALAFLAPIFLAGAALIAVPWIIHQIRRPEREPFRFSSLMFIPKIDKQIIERRRIQHILLMLLRMLLLALLAAAFSRPYWKAPQAKAATDAPGRHVIALDASYSMGTLDWFDRAKRRAREVANSIGPDEQVAVVAFAGSPRILAPLADEQDPQAGGRDRAVQAIDLAGLTESGTAYLPALQLAQDVLLGGESVEHPLPQRLVLHLISDFQAGGMPEKALGWKLSPRITLKPIEVGEAGTPNLSIVDLGVRKTAEGKLRVQGKVKNWSPSQEKTVEVRLFAKGEEKEKRNLAISARNASQVSFLTPLTSDPKIEGWLEIGSDALAIDNRRYFIWEPPRKKQALLVADPRPGERWPGARLIETALPSAGELPWELQRLAQDQLEARLRSGATRPDLLIACDWNGLKPGAAEALLAYVAAGGEAIFMLNGLLQAEALNPILLNPMGLSSKGLRHAESRESRFDAMSWVDFDHPIFAQFRGARFNDFSQLRFYNYHNLSVVGARAAESAAPKVLAKLEGKEVEAPAIVETAIGKGRLLLWAFGPDLAWTNLPKSIKFVPLLYESLGYLTGVDEARRSWEVGEKYAALPKPSGSSGRWAIELPGEAAKEVDAKALAELGEPELSRSGFLRWKEAAGEKALTRVDAVNIHASEADPTRIGVQEFELKLTAAPAVASASLHGDQERRGVPAGFVVKSEYWQVLIGLMFAFLLVESWYAFRLIR